MAPSTSSRPQSIATAAQWHGSWETRCWLSSAPRLPTTMTRSAPSVPATTSGMGLEGLSSPLVGREHERGVLEDAAAATEGGRVISVLAEAGLGKSRLVAEVREGWQGTTWMEGRGLSYGQTIAYYPWRHVIYGAI